MRHLAARLLLLYTALSLFFTWPLARHFTTHMPGNGIDDPALGWNLWWVKARLVDQLNFDIFHVDWLFHPIQINLAFYTLTPLNGLISIPLQSAFGLIIANNLVLLSSFVLSGYGVYLLVSDQIVTSGEGRGARGVSSVNEPGRSAVAGSADESNPPLTTHHPRVASGRVTRYSPLVAGLIYAFASNKLFYAALGQYNIASSQWIPFCILYLLRMGRSSTWPSALRNAALAGLFLVFQTWAELTYASFLLIFIAIYACWLFITRWQYAIRNTQYVILSFLAVGSIFLLGLTPFLWAMLPDLRTEGDFFTSGGGFSDTYSADLAGYLVPTRLHWLLGDWVRQLPFSNDVGQQIYIGYSVLGILVFAAITAPRYLPLATRHPPLFWLLTTLFFWWLTLGPRVRWLGQETAIPGPFAWISLLPFFNGNRYPSRYGVMVLLGVAVLVGIGYWAVGNRYRGLARRSNTQSLLPNTLFALLLLGFVAEHLSLPLPLNAFHVPAIYAKLATVPGDFAVLELPTGWRNGARVLGKSDKLIMMQQWYQTVHGKQRLGGNTSRNPPHKFQYFTEAPLIGDLIALMNSDPNDQPTGEALARALTPELDALIQRNRLIAPQVLDFLDVRYVTLHVEKATPALTRFVEEALPITLVDSWQGVDWEGKPSTIRLYQVQQQSTLANWEVNLASDLGNLHLAAGWSAITAPEFWPRFATRRQAALLLDLAEQGGQLELELFGPNSHQVQIRVNGQSLDPATFQWLESGCLLHPLEAQRNNQSSPLPRPRLGWQFDHWQTPCRLAVMIPSAVAIAGLDQLALEFSPQAAAVTEIAQTLQPERPDIGKTGLPLYPGRTLVVESAGLDVGNFAHIYFDGQELAQQQRGYNLVAIEVTPMVENGYRVLESAVFDTHLAPDQSEAMMRWLQRWPPGTIIAGAVQDEASRNLGQNASNALSELGVRHDLRGRFRASHAFIGVVNAPVDAALEKMSFTQPARVYLGAPVNGPSVYGGMGRVKFAAHVP